MDDEDIADKENDDWDDEHDEELIDAVDEAVSMAHADVGTEDHSDRGHVVVINVLLSVLWMILN